MALFFVIPVGRVLECGYRLRLRVLWDWLAGNGLLVIPDAVSLADFHYDAPARPCHF